LALRTVKLEIPKFLCRKMNRVKKKEMLILALLISEDFSGVAPARPRPQQSGISQTDAFNHIIPSEQERRRSQAIFICR
jgi:hypothetical protein